MSTSSIVDSYGRDWVSFEQKEVHSQGELNGLRAKLALEARLREAKGPVPVVSSYPIHTDGSSGCPQPVLSDEPVVTFTNSSSGATPAAVFSEDDGCGGGGGGTGGTLAALAMCTDPGGSSTDTINVDPLGSDKKAAVDGLRGSRNSAGASTGPPPPRLGDWTVEHVAQWVSEIPVGAEMQFIVRDHAINGAVLETITEEDLLSIGVHKFGWRRQLLLSLRELLQTLEQESRAAEEEVPTEVGSMGEQSTAPACSSRSPKPPQEPHPPGGGSPLCAELIGQRSTDVLLFPGRAGHLNRSGGRGQHCDSALASDGRSTHSGLAGESCGSFSTALSDAPACSAGSRQHGAGPLPASLPCAFVKEERRRGDPAPPAQLRTPRGPGGALSSPRTPSAAAYAVDGGERAAAAAAVSTPRRWLPASKVVPVSHAPPPAQRAAPAVRSVPRSLSPRATVPQATQAQQQQRLVRAAAAAAQAQLQAPRMANRTGSPVVQSRVASPRGKPGGSCSPPLSGVASAGTLGGGRPASPPRAPKGANCMTRSLSGGPAAAGGHRGPGADSGWTWREIRTAIPGVAAASHTRPTVTGPA